VRNDDPILSTRNPYDPKHTKRLLDPANQTCGDDYIRVPEITVLFYWRVPSDNSEMSEWRLSSDGAVRGGSLHADWIGGWDDEIMQRLIDGCLTNVGSGRTPTGQNCAFGQLGDSTDSDGNPERLTGRAGREGNLQLDPKLYRVAADDLPG